MKILLTLRADDLRKRLNIRDGIDGQDGKNGLDGRVDENSIIQAILSKIPAHETPKDLTEEFEALKKRLDETNTRFMGLGAAGGAKGRVHIYDASSQLNGVLKTFSIPTNFGILGVFSTQFPNIFRPIIDYTIGNKSITLTAGVSAPTTGQSLIIQYIR